MKHGVKGRIAMLALLALPGCGQGGPPDPTQEDAIQGLSALTSPLGPHVSYGNPTAPTNCQSGKLGDQIIRSCEICVVLLVPEYLDGPGPVKNLILERVSLSSAFKRAISYGQADIAPVDQSSGVWVPALADASSANYTVLDKKTLGDEDFSLVGLNVNHNPLSSLNIYYNLNNDPHFPMPVQNAGDLLPYFRNTPSLEQAMLSKIGECPSH
jgi:hypothetical protein